MTTNARRRLPRRRSRPGTSPGTLSVDPQARRPEIQAMIYDADGLVEEPEVKDLAWLESQVGTRAVTWINVSGLGDAEVLTTLGRIFGLHRLALEDVVNLHQRPKVEDYEGNQFVVVRMPRTPDTCETEQMSLFLGKNFVITFQEAPGDCLDPVRKRIREGSTRIRSSGADYLTYAILDAVTDGYFPVLEHYGDRLLALEENLLGDEEDVPVAVLHALKRDLHTLRGHIRPLREVFTSLLRTESTFFTPATLPFLRDCYDHAMQLIDQVESQRELALGLIELHRSNVGNRMNEVMKVLTIIATVFMPMSFIAGLYGMNFNPSASRWNMPELGWHFGYPFALGLMAAVAAGMIFFFRKRGWIG